MSITVKDLSHVYAQGTVFEFEALKDINFEIGAHDFIGIIGHTGSGKSTTLASDKLLISSIKALPAKPEYENKSPNKLVCPPCL